jgi:hypothetical protein
MTADRDKILARRRHFVAVALAGAGLASADACAPKVCLEPIPEPTVEVPEGGGELPGGEPSSEPVEDAGPKPPPEPPPQPCLSPEPPSPRVCLRMMQPPAPSSTAPAGPAPKVCLLMMIEGDEP